MHNPGPLPELAWLPIEKLSVDHRYQRTLESRRSQALIERIASSFRWSAFQAILATPDGQNRWLVLDGQHRIEAARRHRISHVPAVVIDAASLEDQAAAFVSANNDRVAVNPYALHHARLVAKDPKAIETYILCRDAGLSIPRYPIPANNLKSGETLALATIERLPARFGHEAATAALRAVATAYREKPGGVRADIISAAAGFLKSVNASQHATAAENLTRYLQRKSWSELLSRALRRREINGGKTSDCYIAIFREEIRLGNTPRTLENSFIKPPSKERLMAGR